MNTATLNLQSKAIRWVKEDTEAWVSFAQFYVKDRFITSGVLSYSLKIVVYFYLYQDRTYTYGDYKTFLGVTFRNFETGPNNSFSAVTYWDALLVKYMTFDIVKDTLTLLSMNFEIDEYGIKVVI